MRNWKYKMYTNAKKGRLDNQLDRFGIVYNHCIALLKKYYDLKKEKNEGLPEGEQDKATYISSYDMKRHLTRIKHRPKWEPIFEGLPSQAVQDVVERIDRAYKKFFKSRKEKKDCSPPKFKRVKKYASYTLKQAGYRFKGNKVQLNGTWYGFHKSRDWKGKVKTVTVKRDRCGDFWLIVTTDWIDVDILPKSGKSVGYDFSMANFLIASDYQDHKAPLFLNQSAKKNKKLSRAISRKPKAKGSNNRKKAILAKARYMRTLTNRRNDFQWKLANALVREYDVMYFETLSLKGMAKRGKKKGQSYGRARFGRKISEYGFADFLTKLKYKAAKAGKDVILVDRWFSSSQTCHVCGFKNAAVKDLHVREWDCPNCHTHHDRDRNAAMNILLEGTSSSRRDAVSPSPSGLACVATNLESQLL